MDRRMIDTEDTEREKYQRVWTHHSYRAQADGVPVVGLAFRGMKCKRGESLIDWGCGTGLPAQAFVEYGLKVTAFDIAENCLNQGINVPLVVGCLWSPPPGLESDYGFSADVLEHIPPDKIDLALDAIRARTRKAAYFQVDTVADISGPRMQPPLVLHLTIRDGEWWREQLASRWSSVIDYPGAYTRVGFLCCT
jgi:hypothetical protein